ncbi:MAG: hypothetical protein ACR2JE_08765 [Acidobacteriaceae bacterium]
MPERLSKRSICQFLLLVVAGLFCLFLLFEILIHARPHASPSLKNGGSMLRLPGSPFTVRA